MRVHQRPMTSQTWHSPFLMTTSSSLSWARLALNRCSPAIKIHAPKSIWSDVCFQWIERLFQILFPFPRRSQHSVVVIDLSMFAVTPWSQSVLMSGKLACSVISNCRKCIHIYLRSDRTFTDMTAGSLRDSSSSRSAVWWQAPQWALYPNIKVGFRKACKSVYKHVIRMKAILTRAVVFTGIPDKKVEDQRQHGHGLEASTNSRRRSTKIKTVIWILVLQTTAQSIMAYLKSLSISFLILSWALSIPYEAVPPRLWVVHWSSEPLSVSITMYVDKQPFGSLQSWIVFFYRIDIHRGYVLWVHCSVALLRLVFTTS